MDNNLKETENTFSELTDEALAMQLKAWSASVGPVAEQRMAALRLERATRLGIKVDERFKDLLSVFTWSLQVRTGSPRASLNEAGCALFGLEPHGESAVSGSRLLHSLIYGRPLGSYGRSERILLKNRDKADLRSSNIPKDCSISASVRAGYREPDVKSVTGIRGLGMHDGKYHLRFSVNYTSFYYGEWPLDSLAEASEAATILHEQLFSVAAAERLSKDQLKKVGRQLVNPLREKAGLKPLRNYKQYERKD